MGQLHAGCSAGVERLHSQAIKGGVVYLLEQEWKRRPDGSVGMALVLPALTDCRWWFESLLVHSGVSSATRRKATGADQKKN